ncbi:formyl transferase [Seongchinamella unica]|uniref:Formyl transferase n=1 Tax=Seongchinamella unica TaxID=2547392 RepID=A0A4R5LSD7_9GAMM|nr:formyl transferase [Seongchinamella unica]TDG13812.1 formyl transferase [Seongchinamella unica]
MKILVLANSDLASNYALNLLLPALQGHRVTLLLSSAVGGTATRPEPLQQLKFFEQQLFNELLFPLLDRAGARRFRSFAGLRPWLAADPGIENAINSGESVAGLAAEPPDLILSIRYGGILREHVIAIPRHGVINLHSGRLPRYRGVMASFWAMLAGEKELGTTLHTIDDSSIDTGRVIATTSTALSADRSYLWNVLNLYPAGIQCMLDAVAALAAGNPLQTRPQGEAGRYFTFPTEEELQAFFAAGHRLYDPAETIDLARKYYLGESEDLS